VTAARAGPLRALERERSAWKGVTGAGLKAKGQVRLWAGQRAKAEQGTEKGQEQAGVAEGASTSYFVCLWLGERDARTPKNPQRLCRRKLARLTAHTGNSCADRAFPTITLLDQQEPETPKRLISRHDGNRASNERAVYLWTTRGAMLLTPTDRSHPIHLPKLINRLASEGQKR